MRMDRWAKLRRFHFQIRIRLTKQNALDLALIRVAICMKGAVGDQRESMYDYYSVTQVVKRVQGRRLLDFYLHIKRYFVLIS